MTGLRFAIHCGILSDLPWLQAIGFDEAGLVTSDLSAVPHSNFIHAYLNCATFSPFNDGTAGMQATGGMFAGSFQAVDKAGWDMLAGGNIGGSVVRTAMNHLTFCNYGADDSDNVYAPPYNHPTTGPNTFHVDYITTWTSGRWYQDCIDAQKAAVAAGGCAEVGILIGLTGVGQLLDSERWIALINAARRQGIPCNNVCFYGDQNTDGIPLLKTGQGYEVITGLMRHFGVRHGIGST